MTLVETSFCFIVNFVDVWFVIYLHRTVVFEHFASIALWKMRSRKLSEKSFWKTKNNRNLHFPHLRQYCSRLCYPHHLHRPIIYSILAPPLLETQNLYFPSVKKRFTRKLYTSYVSFQYKMTLCPIWSDENITTVAFLAYFTYRYYIFCTTKMKYNALEGRYWIIELFHYF